MGKGFCQVLISSRNKKETNKILNILLNKKLIAGSLVIKGLSRYWWKGRIIDGEYINILGFSLIKNKIKIISEVKRVHSDKCPIIAFFKMDGNAEFLKWIKESIQ